MRWSGIQLDKQMLLHRGRVLADDLTASYYNLEGGSFIDLAVVGGVKPKVFVPEPTASSARRRTVVFVPDGNSAAEPLAGISAERSAPSHWDGEHSPTMSSSSSAAGAPDCSEIADPSEETVDAAATAVDAEHAPAVANSLEGASSLDAEPLAVEPLAAEPLAAEPEPAEPLAAAPPEAKPLDAEPLAAEPLAAEPEPAEQAVVETGETEQAAEATAVQSEVVVEQAVEPEAAEMQEESPEVQSGVFLEEAHHPTLDVAAELQLSDHHVTAGYAEGAESGQADHWQQLDKLPVAPAGAATTEDVAQS